HADGEILLGALDGENVVGIAADDARLARSRSPLQRRIERLDLRHAMARGDVAGLGGHERRVLQALLDGEAAARAEAAARRRVEQVGRRTVDGGELGAAAAIEPGYGGEQAARVG